MSVEKELAVLAKRGRGVLRAADVIEFAKDPTTALHSRFTWDDTEAAHKYRLIQARNIIVSVKILEPRVEHFNVQAYVSVPSDRGKDGGGYRRTTDVLKSPSKRQELHDNALEEGDRWAKKYQALDELRGVFSALSEARKRRDDD